MSDYTRLRAFLAGEDDLALIYGADAASAIQTLVARVKVLEAAGTKMADCIEYGLLGLSDAVRQWDAAIAASIPAPPSPKSKETTMSDNDLIRRGDALAEVELFRGEWSSARDAIAALAASIPADPVTNAGSCQSVKIKPLVWVRVSDTDYYARGEDIRISSNGKGWGGSPRDFPHFGDYPHPTLEDAMAAEQAAYEARILAAIEPTNMRCAECDCTDGNCTWIADEPAPVTPAEAEGHWEDFLKSAVAEAEKAMRKFPQPNYVISKVAEEAGEVVKAAIHCAESRETAENVRDEMRQLIAMLYRLWVEGDQVHGLPPISTAALRAIREGEV